MTAKQTQRAMTGWLGLAWLKAESAMHKLKEFADLGYPAQERVRACRVLARERDWQVWMMAATLQKHM